MLLLLSLLLSLLLLLALLPPPSTVSSWLPVSLGRKDRASLRIAQGQLSGTVET